MLTFKKTTRGMHEVDDGSKWLVREAPVSLPCTLIGHNCHIKGKTVDVPCAELTLLRAYDCGIRDAGSHSRWSSNVRYIVYEWKPTYGWPSIVIVTDCGGGPCYWTVDQLDFYNTWVALAGVIDDATAWDLLSALTGTYDKGFGEGSKKMSTLFLQGRLKRRKRQGAHHLEILPS